MAKIKIMIEENDSAKKLYPVTLTRAAFDINVGGYTLYGILEEYFSAEISYKVRDEVAGITSLRHPQNRLSCDIVIDANAVPSLENMKRIERILKTGKYEKLDMLEYPHHIIVWHKKICKESIEMISDRKRYERPEDGVCIGKNVLVHESCVLDASDGPIVIDDDSVVMPFAYIAGPAYIGKKSKIIDHASIKKNIVVMDTCKVGGEVEDSIIMSYSNKQHHGFLGNSFVGEWVNMGAGTTTSDLKNTYGTISVSDGIGNKVDTGERFLGSIIADYAKTAINTSIFTGKLIGVNCMIYGFVDRDVPSFVNLQQPIGRKNEEFLIDKAIETQKRMFSRRKVEQRREHIVIMNCVFVASKKQREEFLRM